MAASRSFKWILLGVIGIAAVGGIVGLKAYYPPFRKEIFADLHKTLLKMESSRQLGGDDKENEELLKTYSTELKLVQDRFESKLEKECAESFETIFEMDKDIRFLRKAKAHSNAAKNQALQRRVNDSLGRVFDGSDPDEKLEAHFEEIIKNGIKKRVQIDGFYFSDFKSNNEMAQFTISANELAKKYGFPAIRLKYTAWLEADCDGRIENMRGQLSETLKRRLKNGGSAG